MRPQTDPRYQPQFQPLASPSLPPADVVDFRGYFKVETFGHSAVIYRPGMPADKVYLLRSGRVRLLRQGKGKSRSVLSILKPGDLFGEVLRPDGSLMEELAVSSGKCEVWSIEGRDFRALLEARPALAVDVIRALNERVRQLRQRVLGLTRKDVPARLAEMLIALAQAHGERIAPANELCLHG
ncbi:MAG: Crp/Fnr family transcriptional regulator, partial [Deltaproteobacteria bacterium]